MPQRRSSASWKPGQSGNPRGRPPAPVDIAALARKYGPRCIEVAAALLKDPDPRIRLSALTALLDRGYGRPAQVIASADGAAPIQLHLAAAQLVSASLIEALTEPAQPEQEQPRSPMLIDGTLPTE